MKHGVSRAFKGTPKKPKDSDLEESKSVVDPQNQMAASSLVVSSDPYQVSESQSEAPFSLRSEQINTQSELTEEEIERFKAKIIENAKKQLLDYELETDEFKL